MTAIAEILTDAKGWLQTHGEPTTVFDEIARAQDPRPLLDHAQIERERDWSALGSQVVGRERRS